MMRSEIVQYYDDALFRILFPSGRYEISDVFLPRTNLEIHQTVPVDCVETESVRPVIWSIFDDLRLAESP